jgi:hypothetical protein
MTEHTALIERSNRRNLHKVAVQVTISETSGGRSAWSGEFVARSAEGIVPNERLALTLETGQKGNARVSETFFDSRSPDSTRIHFTGTGPLT